MLIWLLLLLWVGYTIVWSGIRECNECISWETMVYNLLISWPLCCGQHGSMNSAINRSCFSGVCCGTLFHFSSVWEGLRSRRLWAGWDVCDALWHPFEVILLLVENEQQCTKWFILQCYRQPNIAHGSRSRRILHASNCTPQMVGFVQIVRVNCPSSR